MAIGKNGIANSLQLAERLLNEAHVAVVPGEAFGTDAAHSHLLRHLDDELERGLNRIHQFVVNNS